MILEKFDGPIWNGFAKALKLWLPRRADFVPSLGGGQRVGNARRSGGRRVAGGRHRSQRRDVDLCAGQGAVLDLGGRDRFILDFRRSDSVLFQLLGADAVLGRPAATAKPPRATNRARQDITLANVNRVRRVFMCPPFRRERKDETD